VAGLFFISTGTPNGMSNTTTKYAAGLRNAFFFQIIQYNFTFEFTRRPNAFQLNKHIDVSNFSISKSQLIRGLEL